MSKETTEMEYPSPQQHLVGSEPTIIELPWHKEPDGDFWRAEVIGHVYEVHDDEMADYKKRQCQYDFEARIRSVLAPAALASETHERHLRVTDEMVEAAMEAAEVPQEERAGVAQYFDRIIRAALAAMERL